MRPTDSAARLSIHPLDHLAEVTSPQIYYGENAAAHSAEPADLGFLPSALGDLLPLAHSKRPPLALPSQPDLPSDPEGYPLEAPHRLAFPLAVDLEVGLQSALQAFRPAELEARHLQPSHSVRLPLEHLA